MDLHMDSIILKATFGDAYGTLGVLIFAGTNFREFREFCDFCKT